MFPKSFKKLIDNFTTLPSIGPKMAERLVLFLFKQDAQKLSDFAKSLEDFKKNLRYCKKCFNISEGEFCSICKDSSRNQKTICVVEDALDVFAIEKTNKYNGLYHVLGGTLDPVKSAEIKNLRFAELEKRIAAEKIEEIILATNPTTEGDATALYIARFLKPYAIKTTRFARGLSTGADIEHADEITLSSAIVNRREL
ncbi:MAG TPA: recombination protein RecR [Candidatus Moranbacteria bacterium]|nr:recombination protein RecR [Candidatus Moranbacteria bacterium]HAT74593.1 recombination protein RecR [Candidatus Moranbacteria bacterium]